MKDQVLLQLQIIKQAWETIILLLMQGDSMAIPEFRKRLAHFRHALKGIDDTFQVYQLERPWNESYIEFEEIEFPENAEKGLLRLESLLETVDKDLNDILKLAENLENACLHIWNVVELAKNEPNYGKYIDSNILKVFVLEQLEPQISKLRYEKSILEKDIKTMKKFIEEHA